MGSSRLPAAIENMANPIASSSSFCFVNVAHPRDATDPNSLRRVRSHVAKGVRARGRRARQAVDASMIAEEKSVSPRVSCLLSPVADPLWNPARTLSPQDLFLLDHCTLFPFPAEASHRADTYNQLPDRNHVVLFRNGTCPVPGSDGGTRPASNDTCKKSLFTRMQLTCWLPFSVAHLGLLHALLLRSCRSLEGLCGTESQDKNKYARMGTFYKHQCLRAANDAVSSYGTNVTDATIALVMTLLAEAYVLGDLDEWAVHLRACTEMIQMRGGIDALGLDGFLRQVIVK